MSNIKEIKDKNGSVKAKIGRWDTAESTQIPSMNDLLIRIEALEKQLTDMQAAMSCDLREVSQSSLSSSVGFSCSEFGIYSATK